jgi:anti-sigma B factor antagonist
MPYTLEHDPVDAGHLIAIAGELDIAATPELSTILLMAAGAPGEIVVLDLTHVAFIDSSALGTLLNAGGEVESRGKKMRIVCGDGPVRSLLEMTNLTNRFQLCPTRDEALAAA